MQWIVMLKNKQAGGAPRAIGDVVEVEEATARYLVTAGSARYAASEDIAASRSPLPAAVVRDQMVSADSPLVSTAVPGGKRPQRRTAKATRG